MDMYFTAQDKLEIKVLYVEDETAIREAVAEFLYRRITHLYTASNGNEGLKLFHQYQPEIVITDIRMPEMSGIDMSRQIREASPVTKIIITSAHSDTNYFLEAITIGINEYVFKPILREKLFNAIVNSARGIFMQRELDNRMKEISKLHGAIEQCQSLVAITDKDLNIEYINPKFTQSTGYTLKDFSNNGGSLIFSQFIGINTNQRLKELIELNAQWQGECTIINKEGLQLWLYGSLCPVLDSQNNVVSYISVSEDISEIKQMATALADREDKLRNLIEKLGEGIAVLDLSFKFVFCNKAMEEIFGSQQLLEHHLNQYLVGPKDTRNMTEASKDMTIGEKRHLEVSVKAGADTIKYLSVTITPQIDSKKTQITGFFCIFKDITRLKELIEESQTARNAAEDAYRTIEEKNKELHEINARLKASEIKQFELNEILMEYIKATGK